MSSSTPNGFHSPAAKPHRDAPAFERLAPLLPGAHRRHLRHRAARCASPTHAPRSWLAHDQPCDCRREPTRHERAHGAGSPKSAHVETKTITPADGTTRDRAALRVRRCDRHRRTRRPWRTHLPTAPPRRAPTAPATRAASTAGTTTTNSPTTSAAGPSPSDCTRPKKTRDGSSTAPRTCGLSPPTTPTSPRLYRRRNDAESINRNLDDTLWLGRAHSLGHERQTLEPARLRAHDQQPRSSPRTARPTTRRLTPAGNRHRSTAPSRAAGGRSRVAKTPEQPIRDASMKLAATVQVVSYRVFYNPHGCSSMARAPAFQAGDAGSIPVTRSPVSAQVRGRGRATVGSLSPRHRSRPPPRSPPRTGRELVQQAGDLDITLPVRVLVAERRGARPVPHSVHELHVDAPADAAIVFAVCRRS